jgi:purine/pyrimidine-nucleoside phosphorylase
MIKHNSFFDGRVQSLAFERNGRRQTTGVITPGEYHFNTDGPERMSVVSGELQARLISTAPWITYPAGTVFEVPGKSSFEAKSTVCTAYLCEFL